MFFIVVCDVAGNAYFACICARHVVGGVACLVSNDVHEFRKGIHVDYVATTADRFK